MQNRKKITRKIFPPNICHKWIIHQQKTWTGWLTTLKFCKQIVLVVFWKKAQNNFFVSDPIHGENGIWNIVIFAKYFHHDKHIAVLLVRLLFNSSPHAYFLPLFSTAHCLILQENKEKVKLNSNIHPNMLSEIMRLLENGGRGESLAQISNWHLYMGIAA